MRKQMVGCSMLAGVKSWPWLPGRRGGSTRWRDGSLQPPSGDPSFFHLSSSRPGCAATCATAWLTWKAGTSKPTWPSWIVLWWGPAISQPLKQKHCSISIATSSSEWHWSSRLKLVLQEERCSENRIDQHRGAACLVGGGHGWSSHHLGAPGSKYLGLPKTLHLNPLKSLLFQKDVPHWWSNYIWLFQNNILVNMVILANLVNLIILAILMNLVNLVILANLIRRCQVLLKIYIQ